jgi:hypothetical protein
MPVRRSGKRCGVAKSQHEWAEFFQECISNSSSNGFQPPFTLMVGPEEAKEIREHWAKFAGLMSNEPQSTDKNLLMIYLGTLYIYEVE